MVTSLVDWMWLQLTAVIAASLTCPVNGICFICPDCASHSLSLAQRPPRAASPIALMYWHVESISFDTIETAMADAWL